MNQVRFRPIFEDWQAAARQCLQEEWAPREVNWEETDGPQPPLAIGTEKSKPASSPEFRVPPEFLTLARKVSRHRSPERWALLYRILWRLTHGERTLLGNPADADVRPLMVMARAIDKEMHKMRAFVRFRKVESLDGPHYVAWYEPGHAILRANAPFFVDRFASLRWSILTPEECVHWDGKQLSFTEGVTREAAPRDDELEELWLTYYAHIFNPARIKVGAMEAEMPRRFWKNLPETALIPQLLREAPQRVEQMIDRSQSEYAASNTYSTPVIPETLDLKVLAEAARGCQACPLYRHATQTVFGEGPLDATLVLLGEQPGDQEDVAGRPFVGPAGMLLNRALVEAGLDRQKIYLTNVVKHFKWEPRGKRRLHQTPTARDVAACRPWMEAELRLLRPEILVCLGATAAQTVLGPQTRIMRDRGKFFESPYGGKVLVTIHPSALLRMTDSAAQREGETQFVADLRSAAHALACHRRGN